MSAGLKLPPELQCLRGRTETRGDLGQTHHQDGVDLVMAKLRLLKTGHGDLCLAEWDTEKPDSIERAREAFTQNHTAGRMAFRLDGPGQTRAIREFDATAPEILLVPAIQGGSDLSGR
jgi:hypothetical protein